MATVEETPAVDGEKLMAFVFNAVDEVGGALNAVLVVMGDRLGWYRAMAGAGPLSSGELAERTGTAERYVREWLNAQAAGCFVELTAGGRPFLYFPLRRHFEQTYHVDHRLRRHGAGRRMSYETDGPSEIAAAMAEEIGREPRYLPVTHGGAARAAQAIGELL